MLLNLIAAVAPRKLHRRATLRGSYRHAGLPRFLSLDRWENYRSISSSRCGSGLLVAALRAGSELDGERLAGLKARTANDNPCIIWSRHFDRQPASARTVFNWKGHRFRKRLQHPVIRRQREPLRLATTSDRPYIDRIV